jgi:hypothetical protein
MKKSTISALAIACALTIPHVPAAYAGKEVLPTAAPAKEVQEEHFRTILPESTGSVTLGAQFSDHATGGYIDAVTGLWMSRDRDSFLFFNSRYHLEDNDQLISATGLGFRQMILGERAMIGVNVFWDSIHSAYENDFDQLGLGFELLTKWVDFRFNYYLPDDDQYEIGRSARRESSRGFGPGGFTETTRTSHFSRYEAGLEGLNTEIGFLVPGLDRYAEVRLFAGYYHYNNPFGNDFEGFKARLEARILQGVTADLEYWDDTELNGGHWTGGVRVSLPFTMANLFTGKNPFEGAGDTFKPYRRELKDRIGEMVIRSHRIQTVASGDMLRDTTIRTRVTPVPRSEPQGASRPQPSGGSGFPIE